MKEFKAKEIKERILKKPPMRKITRSQEIILLTKMPKKEMT